MQKRRTMAILLLCLVALLIVVCVPATPSASEAEGGESVVAVSEEDTYDGPITEIAIRRLHEGQDVDAFATARDELVTLLTAQDGVGTDREFAAFLDFGTFAPPEPPVYIGMTEYASLAVFAGLAETLGRAPEAAAFGETFSPLLFTALRPRNPADRYDLATIASEPGQVLEIAARDLSQYDNFDAPEYATKRDLFLAALAEQEGFVAEYQWVSVLDANIVVGMTVYESAEAFQAIATSAFVQSTEYTNMLSAYPPIAGYVSIDARAEEANMSANDQAISPVKNSSICNPAPM